MQLVIVVLLLAGAGGAIWFMMGDAEQAKIEGIVREIGDAAVAGNAKAIVEKLHGNFVFTIDGKQVADFKDLKEQGDAVLKRAKLLELSVRSVSVTRKDDAATAIVNLTLKSSATQVQTPFPFKVEFEFVRSGVEGEKTWQILRADMTPMRER
ncbi:MAG: hypothetical protein AB7S36_12595 [Planctomycetota bacterium]